MNHRVNWNTESVEFFGREVKLSLLDKSPSFNLYGNEVIGRISGRSWGEKQDSNKMDFNVISLQIRLNNELVNIPCSDIITFKENN